MIRDIQINPFTNEILTTSLKEYEITIQIPASANYPDISPNMFVIFLDEIPYLQDRVNFPITIEQVDNSLAYTEVTGVPGINEFRIAPFGSGRPNIIQFNQNNFSRNVKIKYWGWGSVVTYENYITKYGGETIAGDITIEGTMESYMIKSQNYAPTREIFGLKLSNNNTNPNTQIDIGKGWCFDDSMIDDPYDSIIMHKIATGTYAINLEFGSGVGILLGDPNTKWLANASYLIYMIQGDGLGIDFLAVLSTDSFSFPSPQYTRKRRIGVIMTDNSKNIIAFNHYPETKTYYWKTKFSITGWQIPTTETAVAIEVPKGVNVIPIINIAQGTPSNASSMAISIRGIERNYSDFNQIYCATGGYNAELGGYYQANSPYEHVTETLKNINFITTTNGELYFHRKGGYISSGYYSTRQVYGFIDFTV